MSVPKPPRSPHLHIHQTPPESQLPPNNIECERSVLFNVLHDGNLYLEVNDVLKADDFYRSDHAEIWRGIDDLFEQGAPIGVVEVLEYLKRKAPTNYEIIEKTIIDVMKTWANPANVRYHAQVVAENARRCRLIELSDAIRSKVMAGLDDADTLEEFAQTELLRFQSLRNRPSAHGMTEIMPATLSMIARRQEGVDQGLPSGIVDLDELTTGLYPGTLTVIGARPSNGKTALGLRLLEHAMLEMENKTALMFSLEMDRQALAARLLCMRSKIDSHRLKIVRGLTDAQNETLARTAEEWMRAKVWIDDQPGQKVSVIASKVRRAALKRPLSLVVIDYLQLIEGERDFKQSTRQEEVAKITRRLKILAKDAKCPIVLLAQLNRNLADREDKRPRLSDLRESGAIEQDADTVLFLHHPSEFDENDRPGEADIIIAKNRDGRRGTVPVCWMPSYIRFDNLGVPDDD